MEAVERTLMESKWWDYKLVEPETATLIFIREYVHQVTRYMEELGRSRHTNVLKAFSAERPREWRHWNLAEATRMWCDSHGIAYDEFWAWATEEHLRGGWHMTFINAFCGEKMRKKVFERLEAARSQMMKVSRHPFFRAESYRRGCKLQNAYCHHLVAEVRRRYGLGRTSALALKGMVEDGIIAKEFFIPGGVRGGGMSSEGRRGGIDDGE